jgi:hypothetical protein
MTSIPATAAGAVPAARVTPEARTTTLPGRPFPAASDSPATVAVDAGGHITVGLRSVAVLKNPRPPDIPGGR